MFADDLTWLTSSPGWAIATFAVGVALAILGITLTVFDVVIGKDRKIRYALRTYNLLRGVTASKMPDATLTFAGFDSPIEILSVTRLALWNADRNGVKAGDVAKEKPLIIRLSEPGTVILSIGIIQYNLPDNLNKFRCEKAPDGLSASIDFEFMDHHQGIVVQIFHTSISHKGISVEGYITGRGKPKYKFVFAGNSVLPVTPPVARKRRLFTNRRIRLFIGWLAIVGSVLIAGLLTMLVTLPPPEPVNPNSPLWFVILTWFLLSTPFWAIAIALMRPGVPKELSVFEEDF